MGALNPAAYQIILGLPVGPPLHPYLAVDFGTTSTKSALVDVGTGALTRVRHHPAIAPNPGPPGRFEVPLQAIRDRFLDLAPGYADALDAPLAGIVICSEMHGFAPRRRRRPAALALRGLEGRAVPRAARRRRQRHPGDPRPRPRFRAITGMRPRPGFPLMNLVHLLRETPLADGLHVVSLPDWLALAAGEATGLGHPTMLAGHGALRPRDAGRASDELLALVRELTGRTVAGRAPAEAAAVAGTWRHGGRRIPLHVGIGDHQATLLGAGITAADCLSLNLGTGSQLAVLDRPAADDAVERRPYFDGGMLHAITHIPGDGRSPRSSASSRTWRAPGGAPAPDFWRELAALGAADVAAATLDVDLAVFQGAWGYRDGGRARPHRGGRPHRA